MMTIIFIWGNPQPVQAQTDYPDDDAFIIAAFGDSLTAGYRLPKEDGFAPQLEDALLEKGHNVIVINHGLSGDTSAGGLSRMDWMLEDEPDLVILELGANDMLRGIDPKVTKENLIRIMERLKEENIPVLIAGMQAPINYGTVFKNTFDSIYPNLAEEYNAPLMPFFLEGVAMKREYNLADGSHPNAEGVAIIVDNILPYIEEMLPEK